MKTRYIYLAICTSLLLASCSEQKITSVPCSSDSFAPFCSENGNSLISCVDGIVQAKVCECDNGACFECKTDTQCLTISHASAVCSADHACVYACDEHYEMNKEGTACVYAEECREYGGGNNCPAISHATASCSKDYKCEYQCDDDYELNAFGTACFYAKDCHSSDDCPDLSNAAKDCDANSRCIYICDKYYKFNADRTYCSFSGDCRKDEDCRPVSNGSSKCSSEYKCEIKCYDNYSLNDSGTACFFAMQCETDSQCPEIAHAKTSCDNNKCVSNCDDGYILNDHMTGCIEHQTCDSDYKAVCADEGRRYCGENGVVGLEVCPVLCNDGKCVECTENNTSYCPDIDNASITCWDGRCTSTCNNGYIFNKESRTCEEVTCTVDDISACPVPERGIPFCNVTTCESTDNPGDDTDAEGGENACDLIGYCDFTCEDGYVKNAVEQKCDPFVCNESNLENCADQNTETHEAACKQNRCTFKCRSGFVMDSDGACVQCTDTDTTQCPQFANASSVYCSDRKCMFRCEDKYEGELCYTQGENACVPIDEDNNQVADCYEKQLCQDNRNDVVCIRTADEFLSIPSMVKDGKVNISGKKEDAVFYIINDINLAEAETGLKTIIEYADDNNIQSCHAESWKPEDVTNLKLKPPEGVIKTISYTKGDVNCTMPKSLFKTLKKSEISNLNIKLNIKGEASAAFAHAAENTVLTNLTYSGTVSSTYQYSVGGLIHTIKESSVINTVCDGAEIVAEKNQYSERVGCIAAKIKDSTISTGQRVNRVKSIISSGYAGCFAGSAENSTIHDSQNECIEIFSEPSASGFIDNVKNAVIENVTNRVLTEISSNIVVSGFIRSVVADSEKMSDVKIDTVENSINGMIPSQNTAGFVYKNENTKINAVANNITFLQKSDRENTAEYLSGFIHTNNYSNISNITNTVNGSVSVSKDAAGFIYKNNYSNISNVTNTVNGSMSVKNDAAGFIYTTEGKSDFRVVISDVHNRVSGSLSSETESMAVAGFIRNSKYTNHEMITNDIHELSGDRVAGYVFKTEYSALSQINNRVDTIKPGKEGCGFVYNAYNNTSISDVNNEIKAITVDNTERTNDNNIGGFSVYLRTNTRIERIVNRVHSLIVNNTGNHNYVGGFSARTENGETSVSDVLNEAVIQVTQGNADTWSLIAGVLGYVNYDLKMERIRSKASLESNARMGVSSFGAIGYHSLNLQDVLFVSEIQNSTYYIFNSFNKINYPYSNLNNLVDISKISGSENQTVTAVRDGYLSSDNPVLLNFYYIPDYAQGLVQKTGGGKLKVHDGETAITTQQAVSALSNGGVNWSTETYTLHDETTPELPGFTPAAPKGVPEFPAKE